MVLRALDDILLHLSKAHAIILNDATSGYWYVTLDLQSSLPTTFNTPWDKFQWLRLLFGLKVTGDVFQERLDKVIGLLPSIIGIADDILTHGSTIKEHDGRVITLVETARQNNLTLNPKKMWFRSKDFKFLGHRLTPEGLKVDSDKVSAITQMKPLDTIQDLRSFLGMITYLNRFDPTLLELPKPLRRLCKWDVMWTWDSQQQTAFEKIKSIIRSLPVLAYFDQDKNHIIQSDASKKGLSAVLLQDGQPVIYTSWTLTETEQ